MALRVDIDDLLERSQKLREDTMRLIEDRHLILMSLKEQHGREREAGRVEESTNTQIARQH